MRAIWILITWAIAGSAILGEEPGSDRIRTLLNSDHLAITWRNPKTFDSRFELEIGDGNGDDGTLRWTRFHPTKDGVEVLSIEYHEHWSLYSSKWPQDQTPITIHSARMKFEAYSDLLKDLALINSAEVRPRTRTRSLVSFNTFFVYTRLSDNSRAILETGWTGYETPQEEGNYAKPLAGCKLAREAVRRLELKEHQLTEEERAWTGAKFARDWEKPNGGGFDWWVWERYVVMIGQVGNLDAIPTLCHVLKGDPRDRCVYHAINAITRLTKKDVRSNPVEEMDVVKTREKVLQMLREKK